MQDTEPSPPHPADVHPAAQVPRCSILRLSSVTLDRPGFRLGPVSLDLAVSPARSPAGDAVPSLTVLVGPSGSGKSTLLALAAGLLPPTTGTVHHQGVDLRALRDTARAGARRASAAFASQQPLFFAELSVVQNLAWAARRRGSPDPAGEARDALATVGLSDLADRPAALLSGGEQARANVARALCGPASAVLLDEPTAMLDTGTADRIRSLLLETAARRPLLAATHDDVLIAAATCVLRLENGRVVEGS